jgi:hypothetical protein
VLISGMQFTFPDLPGVQVYPDDGSPQTFYAMPATPRIARRDDGQPEISLMLRSKKVAGQSEITGGLLTVTAALGLSQDEESRLISLLTHKLAQDAPPDSDQPPPKPRLLGIMWLSGKVDLNLDPNITISGMPSMFGDNRCAFSISLNADQAKAVSKAWKGGTLKVVVHYQLKAQSAPGSSSRAEASSSQVAVRTDSSFEYFSAAAAGASVSRSMPYEIDVQGSLDLAKSELMSNLTEVSL